MVSKLAALPGWGWGSGRRTHSPKVLNLMGATHRIFLDITVGSCCRDYAEMTYHIIDIIIYMSLCIYIYIYTHTHIVVHG